MGSKVHMELSPSARMLLLFIFELLDPFNASLMGVPEAKLMCHLLFRPLISFCPSTRAFTSIHPMTFFSQETHIYALSYLTQTHS